MKHFIRFVAAKVAVTYAMDLMVKLYEICGGVVLQITAGMGGIGGAAVTLPSAIETAIEDVGFWASIPLWLVNSRQSIHNGIVFYYDNDRLRTVFQIIYVFSISPYSYILFCRRGNFANGKSLYQILCGRMLGGRSNCACLCDIFSLYIRRRNTDT